jgi:hypothetical protein
MVKDIKEVKIKWRATRGIPNKQIDQFDQAYWANLKMLRKITFYIAQILITYDDRIIIYEKIPA